MALDHEEAQELRDVYSNMTGEELRGQLGESADHDALINEILAQGKAVELPGGPKPVAEEAPAPNDDDPEDEDPDDDEEDDQPTEEEEEAPADEPAAEEVVAAPAAEAPVAEAPAPVAAPVVEVPALDLTPLAEKYDQQQQGLDAERAEKFQKLMDGEIDAKEFATYDAQYMRARDTLRDQKAFETSWHKTVHDFRATHSVNGIDYFNNQEQLDSLDAWVKRMAVKHEGKPEAFILEQAHKKVLVEFDIAAPSANPVAEPAKNVPEVKKVSPKTPRTPKLDNIPPTLSGLPAAAPAASGDGGEFDHLAKLDGMAFERALAKMTPDQQARYLAG